MTKHSAGDWVWSMAEPAVESTDNIRNYPAFVQAADEIERRVDLLIASITDSQMRGAQR
jgi:hypothetical protein